jgi:DNA-binding MarR family transcriptional regulator
MTGWLTRTKENASQAAIARQAGLDPNTTSQILRSLQTKKLIERVRSADERSKDPRLTPLGARTLSKALPAVEEADAQFFASLNLKKTNILTALQQLAKNSV